MSMEERPAEGTPGASGAVREETDRSMPKDAPSGNQSDKPWGGQQGIAGRQSCCAELDGHFVIREYGGHPRVGWLDHRGALRTMSFEGFRNAHIEKKIEVAHGSNKRLQSAAALWLEDQAVRRYDRVEFLPGQEPPEDVLNLWRGWPLGLVPGWDDVRQTPAGPQPSIGELDGEEMPPGYCDLFLEHMLNHMCGGDGELLGYLLGWMADALWNPGPCETVVVLRGPEGSGKTLWAEEFAKFFGAHAVTLDDIKQLIGDFNQHLLDKQFVFADEAFFAGNRAHAAKLRTVASRTDQLIEPKGVNSFLAPKWWRLAMASNDEHVIRASGSERRSLVLEVDAGKRNQDHEYFGRMRRELREGGRAALFRWLTGRWWGEQVGEGRFREWVRPVTAALQVQKDLSLVPVEMVIHNMLLRGEPPCLHDAKGDCVYLSSQLLAEAARLEGAEEQALGNLLRLLAGERPSGKPKRPYLGSGHGRRQYRGVWTAPLAVCRQRWEQHLDRPVSWPADVATWGDDEDKAEPPF